MHIRELVKQLNSSTTSMRICALISLRKKYLKTRQGRDEFNSTEGPKLLLKLLYLHQQQDEVIQLDIACSLLANLALDPPLRMRLQDLQGINIANELLEKLTCNGKKSKEEKAVLNRVIRLLANLCLDSRGLDFLQLSPSVLTRIAGLIEVSDTNLQLTCVRAIRIFAAKYCDEAVRLECVLHISSLLSSTYVPLLLESIQALTVLCKSPSSIHATQLYFTSGAKLLVTLAQDDCISGSVDTGCKTSANLQSSACKLIFKLIAHESTRSLFIFRGAVQFFKSLCDSTEKHSVDHYNSLNSLCCLSKENCRVIVEEGILELFLEYLKDLEFEETYPRLVSSIGCFIYDQQAMNSLIKNDLITVLCRLLISFSGLSQVFNNYCMDYMFTIEKHEMDEILLSPIETIPIKSSDETCISCSNPASLETMDTTISLCEHDASENVNKFPSQADTSSVIEASECADSTHMDETESLEQLKPHRYSIDSPTYQSFVSWDAADYFRGPKNLRDSNLKLDSEGSHSPAVDRFLSLSPISSCSYSGNEVASYCSSPLSMPSFSAFSPPASPTSPPSSPSCRMTLPLSLSNSASQLSTSTQTSPLKKLALCADKSDGDSEEFVLGSPAVELVSDSNSIDLQASAHDQEERLIPKMENCKRKRKESNCNRKCKTLCLNKFDRFVNNDLSKSCTKGSSVCVLPIIVSIMAQFTYAEKIPSEMLQKNVLHTLLLFYCQDKTEFGERVGRILDRIARNRLAFKQLINCQLGLLLYFIERMHPQSLSVTAALKVIRNRLTLVAESGYGLGVLKHLLIKGDSVQILRCLYTIAQCIRSQNLLVLFFNEFDVWTKLLKIARAECRHILSNDPCKPRYRMYPAMSCISALCHHILDKFFVIQKVECNRLSIFETDSESEEENSVCDVTLHVSNNSLNGELFHRFERNDAVTFIVDDNEKVTCSRKLLCKKSDYFSAMLNGKFEESSQSDIGLRNVKKGPFLKIIKSLSASVPLCVGEEVMSVDNALNLLGLCDKFMLPHLVDDAIQFCMKCFEPAKLMLILRMARLYGARSLERDALLEFFSVCDSTMVLAGIMLNDAEFTEIETYVFNSLLGS